MKQYTSQSSRRVQAVLIAVCQIITGFQSCRKQLHLGFALAAFCALEPVGSASCAELLYPSELPTFFMEKTVNFEAKDTTPMEALSKLFSDLGITEAARQLINVNYPAPVVEIASSESLRRRISLQCRDESAWDVFDKIISAAKWHYVVGGNCFMINMWQGENLLWGAIDGSDEKACREAFEKLRFQSFVATGDRLDVLSALGEKIKKEAPDFKYRIHFVSKTSGQEFGAEYFFRSQDCTIKTGSIEGKSLLQLIELSARVFFAYGKDGMYVWANEGE